MKQSDAFNFLVFCINHRRPVLLSGSPGVGKTDIMKQAAEAAGAKLIISHPVVADPTDYKGMPWVTGGKAEFLPFGDLRELIEAKVPTVYFLDDLGQAPGSVQAACMQLILARRINGHKVSEFVIFMAATNRAQDRSGVTAIYESVKSRFISIIELEVNTDDWVKWALTHNMPTELISFVQFMPKMLNDFQPSKDMVNSPSPRTNESVGNLINDGVPQNLEYEAFRGAAGESHAVSFLGFLKIWRDLPSVDEIILNPTTIKVSKEPQVLYALSGAIADKLNDKNIEPIMQYLERIPAEFTVCTLKQAATRKPQICATRPFIEWATKNANILI